jgi:hypothetical protein
MLRGKRAWMQKEGKNSTARMLKRKKKRLNSRIGSFHGACFDISLKITKKETFC